MVIHDSMYFNMKPCCGGVCVCGSNEPTLIEFRMKGKLTLELGVRAAQDPFRWFQQDTSSFLVRCLFHNFRISSYVVPSLPHFLASCADHRLMESR